MQSDPNSSPQPANFPGQGKIQGTIGKMGRNTEEIINKRRFTGEKITGEIPSILE
jgi:hypothetical protein